MPVLYRYVHVTDDGMAPATAGGLVSLATCKPVIRRCARRGDWLIGFLPSPVPPGIVGWAGRIDRIMEHADYESSFQGRPDAVYRRAEDGRMVRLRSDYHPRPADMAKDLSGPVLLFDRRLTWYFGDRPQTLPDHLMHLAPRGQGHRVNPRVPGDEEQLLAWLNECGSPGLHGRPRNGTRGSACAPRSAPRCPPRC
jgi:hypothetical protein